MMGSEPVEPAGTARRGRGAMTVVAFALAAALLFVATGCDRRESGVLQGYVEGEFVYVASPLPGTLEMLSVERGAWVEEDDALFTLESVPEEAMRDEAARRLAQARANLEDVKKGKRPSEIQAVEAQLRRAKAALDLAEKEFVRQERLLAARANSVQDVDRARSTLEQDRQRVAQLEADLKTAQLGSRVDQVAAAEANVQALEAALARAEWDLSRKRLAAPQAGLVFDTLYRRGEWVAAGRPVVALLPPRAIKVRAFVPETRIGAVRPGDRVTVRVDGVAEPFTGRVSFISPRAEYTPPVIYSRESRGKLVFMIEATFDPEVAARLHPGQPVDVELGA